MDRIFEVRPLLTRAENSNISAAAIDIVGVGKYVVNVDIDADYTCIKGKATFMIKDGKEFVRKELTPGHKIRIPARTPYLDFSEKGATLVAINKMAFDPEQVIELPLPELLENSLKAEGLL